VHETDVGRLGGLWRRSLIVRADDTRDIDTWVRWLQGPNGYVDLRQPPGRPDFTGARCLRDLTRTQLVWMAGQDGFAGRLSVSDGVFEWRRDIDFQPPGPVPDRGWLTRDGDVMVEKGYHSPYIEHWHHDMAPRPPIQALWLRDGAAGCAGRVVRVGDIFAYARGRPDTLPEQSDLGACIAGAVSIVRAQDLVDCEIAFGSVSAAGWTIERSTLPFKEGRRLLTHPFLDLDRIETVDLDADGREIVRSWDVTEIEGERT